MTQDAQSVTQELKPCPFCGGDAHWCPTYVDADEPGTVTCANGCGATVICSGPKAVRIAAWNARASQPTSAEDAVAWMYTNPRTGWFDILKERRSADWVRYENVTETPLYAHPQASPPPVQSGPAFSQIPPENISNGQPGNEKANSVQTERVTEEVRDFIAGVADYWNYPGGLDAIIAEAKRLAHSQTDTQDGEA
jgi:hypothetical protein